MLKNYPTPEDVIRADTDEISRIIEDASNGQKLKVSPEDLMKLADTTIHCDISNRGAFFGLKMLMEDIEHFDRRIEQIDQEIQIYWDEIKNDFDFSTFPGIDMVKSVALYTEFGGLNRFSHPDKSVAFSGLENFVHISGESKILMVI